MTVTMTPEMEAIIAEQIATGQFATQEEVVRAALLHFRQKYIELKAAIAAGEDDIKHGRVAPLDVQATLARVRAKKSANPEA